MAKAKCYIKGEESNAEKKARDAKEQGNTNSDRRGYYPPPTRDKTEDLTVWTTLPQ